MILIFWMLGFKSAFLLSSSIKRLFSSSSLSETRVASSAYLRLLIFLPVVLIPAYDSLSQALCIMYSIWVKKQADHIQPWCIPYPIMNQSVVPHKVLTIASWPEYRFLRKQVRWSGTPIILRIFHSLLWLIPLSSLKEFLQSFSYNNYITLFIDYQMLCGYYILNDLLIIILHRPWCHPHFIDPKVGVEKLIVPRVTEK